MAPDQTLWINPQLWTEITLELHRRTEGSHESGVFLLGKRNGDSREAIAAIYYDELDPHAYDSGICILEAGSFGILWDRCAALGLSVVADAHVHLFGAGQSRADRDNPMIARPGHLALILPRMARRPVRLWSVGIYQYLGDHRWRSHGGCDFSRVLKIEERS